MPAETAVSGTAVVSLDGVTVRYGKNVALRDVTASFAAGAVGLLGPNGAGKSTLIKSLLGFVVPEHGRMHVLGRDVAKAPLDIRARIGYMPESDAHIPGMTAVSFVAYCGELAGLPRVDAIQRAHEMLFYVGLGEARYRNVETYSAGMKQRSNWRRRSSTTPICSFSTSRPTGWTRRVATRCWGSFATWGTTRA